MRTDAWRAESCSNVHPMLAGSCSPVTLGRVWRILAVLIVYRNINHRRPGFFNCCAKLVEIFRISGREYAAPGFNIVNVEFFRNVRRKIFQLDLLRGGNRARSFAVPSFPPHNELTKWIRRNGYSFSRIGGELDRRPGTSGTGEVGQKCGASCCAGAHPKKLPTIDSVHREFPTQSGLC